MDLLLVSNIALWIGFVILLIVNLALARQVGVLYERVAPAGALMVNQNLQVGDKAPAMSVPSINGEMIEVGVPAENKSQLLFFVSPDCPICNSLMPAFKSAAKAESNWLDVILASDGPEQDHQAYIKSKKLTQFPYVVSELVGKNFGVAKLPYAVLINEQGDIASLGIINSREHLDSLFEAKERNVASIQEYMQKRNKDAEANKV